MIVILIEYQLGDYTIRKYLANMDIVNEFIKNNPDLKIKIVKEKTKKRCKNNV